MKTRMLATAVERVRVSDIAAHALGLVSRIRTRREGRGSVAVRRGSPLGRRGGRLREESRYLLRNFEVSNVSYHRCPPFCETVMGKYVCTVVRREGGGGEY
jgi:hypothetical protein